MPQPDYHIKSSKSVFPIQLLVVVSVVVIFTAGLFLWLAESKPEQEAAAPETGPVLVSVDDQQRITTPLRPVDDVVDEMTNSSLAGVISQDCPECPEMIGLPIRPFVMGLRKETYDGLKIGQLPAARELPVRGISFSDAFAISKHEVTVAEFAAFVEATGFEDKGCWIAGPLVSEFDETLSWRSPGYMVTDMSPVVCVSWETAKRYTDWLVDRTRSDYRLPSEAQWEYVARAGSDAPRGWTVQETHCRYENLSDKTLAAEWPDRTPGAFSACTDNHARPAVIGSFAENAFGVNDMLGNVSELMADCWSPSLRSVAVDGSPLTQPDCKKIAVRGGSWHTPQIMARASFRRSALTNQGYNDVGFRVVKILPLE